MTATEPSRFFKGRHQASAVRAGRALIRAGGTVDGLIDELSKQRGREVRILEIPLPGNAPSGAWIPTEEHDYLIFPAGASPTRRVAVLCHEIGHILLRHEPAFHSSLTPRLMHALAPSLSLETTRRILQRTGYTNPEEEAAEHVGTSLAAALDDRARAARWESSSRLSARLR